MPPLDYDDVARAFDRRYELYDYEGIRRSLIAFVSDREHPRVLEVGCGAGKWLTLLASEGCDVAGLDPSDEMLAIARGRVNGDLRRGTAEALPWEDASFDRVIYVNALHHFVDPPRALEEAWRVLRPGGRLLSIGLDPHQGAGRWYVYGYFPEALTADLVRFPSRELRESWLVGAGFADVAVRVAEHLQFAVPYAQATQDGVLERSFTSQLGVLSPDEYAAGMQRVREAARQDPLLALEVDLKLYATEATRPV
jgi:SAM-dependent methyltransferase